MTPLVVIKRCNEHDIDGVTNGLRRDGYRIVSVVVSCYQTTAPITDERERRKRK